MVPRSITDDQTKFIYGGGKGIFSPAYTIYNEGFFNKIIENTTVKSSFKALKDTSIWERYQLNAAQFSAAKSQTESKLIQGVLKNSDGVAQSFSKFEKDAAKIADIVNETWLRTEYDSCIHQAIMGEEFRKMQEDSDLYPYWIYVGVMDDRERDEHVALEGQIFKIGDPAGDAVYPPDDWNCRCTAEALDDQEVKERGETVNSDSEAKELLDKYVDPQFQYNSGIQGTLPNTGSYFDVMGSANEGNAKLFNLERAIDID